MNSKQIHIDNGVYKQYSLTFFFFFINNVKPIVDFFHPFVSAGIPVPKKLKTENKYGAGLYETMRKKRCTACL